MTVNVNVVFAIIPLPSFASHGCWICLLCCLLPANLWNKIGNKPYKVVLASKTGHNSDKVSDINNRTNLPGNVFELSEQINSKSDMELALPFQMNVRNQQILVILVI